MACKVLTEIFTHWIVTAKLSIFIGDSKCFKHASYLRRRTRRKKDATEKIRFLLGLFSSILFLPQLRKQIIAISSESANCRQISSSNILQGTLTISRTVCITNLVRFAADIVSKSFQPIHFLAFIGCAICISTYVVHSAACRIWTRLIVNTNAHYALCVPLSL